MNEKLILQIVWPNKMMNMSNQISVKEGDFVKAGQRIADKGSSGTDRVKLHFEIRSEGSPVDPLKFLPKRQ